MISDAPPRPLRVRAVVVTAFALTIVLSSSRLCAQPATIDLTRAVVLTPAKKTGPEAKAVQMLVEEVEKRSRVRWDHVNELPSEFSPVILVGRPNELLPFMTGINALPPEKQSKGPTEGYQIKVTGIRKGIGVLVMGNDARGVLFGVGRLLRALRMERDRVTLPADFRADPAPRTKLRGHQLG